MVTPQLQVTKKWRLSFNFQASPEDQEVFSSQRALPLMKTKWKERCSGREKGGTCPCCHLGSQIYSLWCTKPRTHSSLPSTTEERRKKKKKNASKTIRAFAQIYLLQLGEGGQSKDLSPIEREH